LIKEEKRIIEEIRVSFSFKIMYGSGVLARKD